MKLEYENLRGTVKRKLVFKYKPDYVESFRTEIEDSQIIPLIINVFEELEWSIVYQDSNTVEAKSKGDFGKLSGKLIVRKRDFGNIQVISKSLEGNFFDFGRNSKRTGLFVLLFGKLEKEYQSSGKLEELEKDYLDLKNWEGYEIPETLPPPKLWNKPNLILTYTGAIMVSLLLGGLLGFLTVKFINIIGIYEVGIGLGTGYLFGKVLKKTNYVDFKSISIITAGIIVMIFCVNQFTQYQLIIWENLISGFSFFDFMSVRFENGLTIKETNTGQVGLILSWVFQLVFPFLIAHVKVAGIVASHLVEKIPGSVLEYTIYLFDTGKRETEVRAELSLKGWKQKSDQDDIFKALGVISEFREQNRE